MAFQGSLTELHLPDIIQLISVSGKTGVFHLEDGEVRGQIFLNEGQIVHAQVEDLTGEEAVYTLGTWRSGDFRFEPDVETEFRTISKSNTNLLMEAARRLDEWRVLSKKIPSVDLVPEFVPQGNREGQINLNTSEWLILSKIDAARSIRAIAEACGLTVFDSSKILYGLVATGLIRLRDTGPQTASAGAPAALKKLDAVRDLCVRLLGAGGESVVHKHYQKARQEIERGAGNEAIEEAIRQISKAAAILKGPAILETLTNGLKGIR